MSAADRASAIACGTCGAAHAGTPIPSLSTTTPSPSTVRSRVNGVAFPGSSCDACSRPADWAWSGFLFCDECAGHEAEGGL